MSDATVQPLGRHRGNKFISLYLSVYISICLHLAYPSCHGATQFTCDNGRCIPLTSKCNGLNDCRDNSDEKPDLCGESVFPSLQTELTLFLARTACLLRGLYVLQALISYSFLINRFRQIISWSVGPIFTKFSPYCRYIWSQIMDLTLYFWLLKGNC